MKKKMNPRLTRTKREVKRLIKFAEREAKRCVDNPTLSTSLAVDSAGDALEAIKTYLKEKGAADVAAHVRSAHASESWTEQLWRQWETKLHDWEKRRPYNESGVRYDRTQLACDVLSQCITELRQSRSAHASERLIDEIVGDLVRETNIFPSQVTRAKELIRERLSGKQ